MSEAVAEQTISKEAIRIAKLETENRRLKRELADLNAIDEVARSITGTLLIDEVLRGILNGIQRVLSLNPVILGLVNTKTGEEDIKLAIGVCGTNLKQAHWKLRKWDPIWRKLRSDQLPFVIKTSSELRLPRFIRKIFPDQFVKVPMVVKGEVAGSIMAASETGNFAERDIRILRRFSEYAGIAVENGRLYYEVIRSEEELKQTQQQLVDAERLAALGQLATSINHEINNPLCSISMTVQLLKNEVNEKAPELSERIESIERGVERIMEVTRRVSEMKKIQSTEYLPNQLMIDLK